MPTRFHSPFHALSSVEDIHEHVFTGLLLVSDLGWLLLLPAVNPAMLIVTIAYCAHVAWTTDRVENPHESVFWIATLTWCTGNALWMANDFETDAPDGIPTVGHVSDVVSRCLLYAAGVVLAAGLAFELFYFVHLRHTPRFVEAAKGAAAALDDGGEAGDGGRSLSRNLSGKAVAFDGPAFLPNVLRVKSHVEYEGVSHALWIAKDLCWWASVEMFPGRVFFQATTVAVATALLAHNVDAAVLTWRGGNLIGFVNQVTLLCWVSSFTIWCMGEVFWEKYEGDTTGDFTFLTKKPRHWLFLRWWASWVLTIGTVFFFGFWAIYAFVARVPGASGEDDDRYDDRYDEGEGAAKEPPSPPASDDQPPPSETERLLPDLSDGVSDGVSDGSREGFGSERSRDW